MASSWDSQIRSQSCDTSGWGGSQALKLIGIPGLVTASWGAVPHLEVENRKVPAVSRMHQGTADCVVLHGASSPLWGGDTSPAGAQDRLARTSGEGVRIDAGPSSLDVPTSTSRC